MTLTVVISPDWDTYNRWCAKKDIDNKDRKLVVPLVTYSDVYRLYGRELEGARVVRIGEIDDKLFKYFKQALRRNGWN